MHHNQSFDRYDNHLIFVLILPQKQNKKIVPFTFHFLQNQNKLRIIAFWTKYGTEIEWLIMSIK